MTDLIIKPGRLTSAEELDEARARRVGACIWAMLSAAKGQVDSVNWYARGLAEVEAAMAAWDAGHRHPFFNVWERRKSLERHRTPPSTTEIEARRMVLLMCVAFQRMGLKARVARKFAERELKSSHVFIPAPSHHVIE